MMTILIGHTEEEYDLKNLLKIESLGITPHNNMNKDTYNREYSENLISTNISYDSNTCKYTPELPRKDGQELLPSNIDTSRRST